MKIKKSATADISQTTFRVLPKDIRLRLLFFLFRISKNKGIAMGDAAGLSPLSLYFFPKQQVYQMNQVDQVEQVEQVDQDALVGE